MAHTELWSCNFEECTERAEVEARTAKERADRAEAEAQAAEEKVADAKKRANKVEAEARTAKDKVANAETQARDAVEQFKSSPTFDKEVEEAALDGFFKGFEICKGRVSRAFNLGGLDNIQPEDPDEVEPAKDEAVKGPGTVEP